MEKSYRTRFYVLRWTMIERSFIIFYGIGEKTEQKLWKQGITTWQKFIHADDISGFSETRRRGYSEKLQRAAQELKKGNVAFFSSKLPSSEIWRLYSSFKDHCCFLDIETTGLSHHSEITMVGIFKEESSHILVKDIDLTEHKLSQLLNDCKLLITFNGKTFDIPFLRRDYPSINWNAFAHLDLRYLAANCGFKGGLKNLETELGIQREDRIGEITGRDAIQLWEEWALDKNKAAFDLLYEYNKEDIKNLQPITEMLIHIKQEEFSSFTL